MDSEQPQETRNSSLAVLGESPVLDWEDTRPLVLYAYKESDSARENLKFFLSQGLHGAADFVFILNGETNIGDLIPEKSNSMLLPTSAPKNI